MMLATLTRHAANTGQALDVLNLVLVVAIIVLVVIAVAKLCGAAIAPRATWWGLLIAAVVLLIVWSLW